MERPLPLREEFKPKPTHTSTTVPHGIPGIHAIWLGRDKLLDWHQRLESRFHTAVIGFYIRFRLEDGMNGRAHYKVGRIKRVTEEWRIFVDLGKGVGHRGETTGIDCVSNSIFTQDEVRSWYDGAEHSELPALIADVYHTEARMRNVEAELRSLPEPAPRKKGKQPKPAAAAEPTERKQDADAAAAAAGPQPPRFTAAAAAPHTPSKPLPGKQAGTVMASAAAASVMTPASPAATPQHTLQQVQPQPPPPAAMAASSIHTPMASRVPTANARSRSRSHSRSPPPPKSRSPAGGTAHAPQLNNGARAKCATLSTQVLLVDDKGDPKGVCLMSDVVNRATAVEPDTPMGSQANFDPFASFDAGKEQDLLGTASTILRVRELEQSEPADEMHRPLEATAVLHMIMEAAVDGGREFSYARPREFGSAILNLCRAVKPVLEKEPMLQRFQSPIYVFGDIHGNFFDLYTFMKNVIAFGELNYTAADLLFLGDYVDRGTCSVECITFLLAYKLLSPGKICLLRGNHESPEVNGDVATYGTVSFRHQCLLVFGQDMGTQVWNAVNGIFKFMSLAAIIDDRIFCTHGGIPQYYGGPDFRMDILLTKDFPRFEEVQSSKPDGDSNVFRQFVSDLLWSDPAEEGMMLNEHGFGSNPRGPGIKTFGRQAVDVFLNNFDFDYIIRAHQEKSNGLRVSDNARVITIFSSSDYGGHQNGAGVLLISKGKIRMAIKDPLPLHQHVNDHLHHTPQSNRRPNSWY